MAKIFYSMSGEGRGHAARVRAVTEHLRPRHSISLFAPRDAYDFLSPLYAGTEVEVHPLPGLLMAYGSNDRVDYLGTAARAARYLARLPRLTAQLSEKIEREGVDLVITDFEPALPRAAKRAGVPFLSLNHQHFLTVSDLSGLPARLRLWARLVKPIVRAYHQGQRATIVSSFYSPPLKKVRADVCQVGVMIRPALREAQPTDGTHLVAYMRRSAPSSVLEALASCGREVRVYGLGEDCAGPPLTYRGVNEECFVEDLLSCAAVVSTAGNQLVGEALSLGKPVLAFPEPGDPEQEVNAHYLQASGAGQAVPAERLDNTCIRAFLGRADEYRRAARRQRWDGTAEAVRVIEQHLPRPRLATDPFPALQTA